MYNGSVLRLLFQFFWSARRTKNYEQTVFSNVAWLQPKSSDRSKSVSSFLLVTANLGSKRIEGVGNDSDPHDSDTAVCGYAGHR